jgi:hypothetical protein
MARAWLPAGVPVKRGSGGGDIERLGGVIGNFVNITDPRNRLIRNNPVSPAQTVPILLVLLALLPVPVNVPVLFWHFDPEQSIRNVFVSSGTASGTAPDTACQYIYYL